MSLTDARRLWKLLNEAGTAGLHSHDIRSMGVSGNPSQRAKDIADHVPIFTVREPRGKRPGSRYFLAPYAPDYAVPVQPNFGSAAASVEGADGGAGETSRRSSEKEHRPRLTLVWDFTGEESAERWEYGERAA